MMQRSNQNPRLQGDGSFGLGGSTDVPEPTLDVSLTRTDSIDISNNDNEYLHIMPTLKYTQMVPSGESDLLQLSQVPLQHV